MNPDDIAKRAYERMNTTPASITAQWLHDQLKPLPDEPYEAYLKRIKQIDKTGGGAFTLQVIEVFYEDENREASHGIPVIMPTFKDERLTMQYRALQHIDYRMTLSLWGEYSGAG